MVGFQATELRPGGQGSTFYALARGNDNLYRFIFKIDEHQYSNLENLFFYDQMITKRVVNDKETLVLISLTYICTTYVFFYFNGYAKTFNPQK